MPAPPRARPVVVVLLLLLLAACDGGVGDGDLGLPGTDDAPPGEAETSGVAGEGDAAAPDPVDEQELAERAAACDLDLPDDGPASLQGMAEDPTGTAVINNPELSIFAEALQEAGLARSLDDPDGTFTLLAPSDAAFGALPEEELDELLADRQG
jgi:hypothetical protein